MVFDTGELSSFAFEFLSSFQDIALLDTVEQYGPHSWDEVARILEPILGKVSPQQLEEHFQWLVCKFAWKIIQNNVQGL